MLDQIEVKEIVLDEVSKVVTFDEYPDIKVLVSLAWIQDERTCKVSHKVNCAEVADASAWE